ncbi:hypothetical protein Hanom_Chr01g00080171 [Helianthus anomalus]
MQDNMQFNINIFDKSGRQYVLKSPKPNLVTYGNITKQYKKSQLDNSPITPFFETIVSSNLLRVQWNNFRIIPEEIAILAGLDESLRIIIKVIDGHEWAMEIQALKMSLQKCINFSNLFVYIDFYRETLYIFIMPMLIIRLLFLTLGFMLLVGTS